MKPKLEEEPVYMIKLAEQSERYLDMVNRMRTIIAKTNTLSPDLRNLLSSSYKNYIGSARNAWRILLTVDHKNKDKVPTMESNAVKKYKQQIQKEITETSDEIIGMLETSLLPNAVENDCKAFYLKMIGDFYRYKSECSPNDKKKKFNEYAIKSYSEAMKFADKLITTNPIRLGVSLNFAVFYYEILNNPIKACMIAKESFDNAITNLGDLKSEDKYKETFAVLQLLKDNITVWNADIEENSEKVHLK
jgi:14-3-3 protein epsilon